MRINVSEVPEPETPPDPKVRHTVRRNGQTAAASPGQQVQNQDILRNVTDAIRATAAEAISILLGRSSAVGAMSCKSNSPRYIKQCGPQLVRCEG